MEPSSPESPSKKRKQPINGLKRDQPLFTGRRPYRSLQQPPEFFTDSLNTSYIPSPSPPKSPTRRDIRAKPRQALGNGRSLAAAAFKAKTGVNDENRPPSSGSSSDRRRAQEALKPRPAPTNATAKRLAVDKPSRNFARTRTPTPPRGRQISVTSPANSESSPGRGYAEAYQRIVEEENLAQEDSIEGVEEAKEDDPSNQEMSQDINLPRSQRRQSSNSPVSLKASRKVSPKGASEEDSVVPDDKINMTHDSDNESSIEHTENITETSLDSGSSQYAKDLQRLGALKNGAKAFSKARVGEKVGLTVENLQRQNGSNESLGSFLSAGSVSNRGSDPSVNIPKAWGRKAKPGNDWLARINSRSGRFTGDVPKRHSSGDQMIAENQRREWEEPIDQWISTAAEVPLPPSDDKSPQTRESSQGTTPRTALQRHSSLDRRRQWELEDDFTGRSLQMSESPPIRIRNAALDRIREREMQNLEKRAVTTSRLGELRERSSREGLRRTKSTQSLESPHQDEQGIDSNVKASRRPSNLSDKQAEPQKSAQNETPENSLHDEGEHVPDTPVVIYRSNSHDHVTRDQRNYIFTEDESESSRRPSHERKDSHDLLKRLARVTSESPSPTREQADDIRPTSQPKAEKQTEQTPQLPRSIPNLKTPVITGAWVDQTLEKTPQASMTKSDLKTPLVTGAWIDTPLPTGGRGPPMPTPSDQEEQKELNAGKVGAADLIHRLSPNAITSRPRLQSQAPLRYSGPPLAKSALEEIVNEARSTDKNTAIKISSDSDSEENPSLHLGESTIQSLEELIANDEDFSTLLAPTPPSPETSNPSSDPSPSSQALTTSTATTRSSRLTDIQSYTHLLSRLTNLAPSLRASKKRIETLERAVSTVPESNQLQPQPTCNEAGELHDFLIPCRTCGCPGGAARNIDPDELRSLLQLREGLTTITLPIPRLWRWRRDDWRPRLTWLGFFTFLAYGLYLIESYARFKFCHPLYARTMVGYGVDADAPQPPFVAVKVLWRYSSLGTVMGPLYNFLRLVVKLVGSILGYFIGFVFGDDGQGGRVRERMPVSRDARIPRPSWGPDLSLMDDEYL